MNHHNLKAALENIGHSEVNYTLDFVDLEGYWETAAEIMKPPGHIVSITENSTPLNLNIVKNKSVTFSCEFMYTRTMFTTEDTERQHQILNKVNDLLELGKTIGKTAIQF